MSKVCKGTGKAKGYGCGNEIQYSERNGLKSYKAKYGLGLDCCYTNWLISDNPKAKETFDSLLIKAKKKYDKNKKELWNKEKLEIKKSIETKSDLEKKLQKEINLIVRLIDKGHKCISSGRDLGKSYDAGHLYTTGGNPTLRFHLHNIYAQSVHDNQHKSGNELEYFLRLETVFNKELQDFVLSLKQIDSLHLMKDELRNKIDLSRGIIKWLKLQDKEYSTLDRLELRNRFNLELGIYPIEYCEFKN